MRFLVTGGYFDASGECAIFLADFSDESARMWLRFIPPAHLHVPLKGFAGGCRAPGGAIYVSAHAFVARLDPRRATVDGLLHQPCFNDLHHVAFEERAEGGRLWVSNTGLGNVDVFDLAGRFQGSHSLLPAWVNTRRMAGALPPPWGRLTDRGWSGAAAGSWAEEPDPDDSYHTSAQGLGELPFHQTKVRDHQHANHVSFVDGRPLVTCLYDGTVRDLMSFEPVARIPGAFPHDGKVCEGALWLTTIEGHVIRFDVNSRPMKRTGIWDVAATGHYGWCRGLHVERDVLYVGMTEVRRGRLPRHRWSDKPPAGSETSVLCIDRQSGRLLGRVDLTDRDRHLKIYSLIPLEESE